MTTQYNFGSSGARPPIRRKTQEINHSHHSNHSRHGGRMSGAMMAAMIVLLLGSGTDPRGGMVAAFSSSPAGRTRSIVSTSSFAETAIFNRNNNKNNNNYIHRHNNNNNNNTSSNGGSSHRGQGADAILIDETTHQPCGTTAVRVYSVEVWNEETGELAGGELGYSVGGMYTSLTGFSAQDAAGSVQLLALGKLLMKCGFEYWDLGMEMDYKLKIGAELMPRMSFVREVHRSRVQCRDAVLCCEGERMNAKELIDWEPMKSKGISESCSRASSTVAESTCESQEEQEEVVNVDVTDNIGATATVTSSQKTSKKRPHAAN
mmetsp:Transcript_1020/g.2103  ORF Transcript_1020/g.2103 Transcript_1020/m.2103 type:complete len:319 (-) Transcript_1020:60-1016(-)